VVEYRSTKSTGKAQLSFVNFGSYFSAAVRIRGEVRAFSHVLFQAETPFACLPSSHLKRNLTTLERHLLKVALSLAIKTMKTGTHVGKSR